jgi:hypothetical protein
VPGDHDDVLAFDYAGFGNERRRSRERRKRISKHQQYGPVHRFCFVLVEFCEHDEWRGEHFCEQYVRDEHDGCAGGVYCKHGSGKSSGWNTVDGIQRQQSGAVD